MFVAIDDTDSQDRMCTTYLIYRIIAEGRYDIIDDPQLVRLNPNIGYKTRGNGALNICLGKGGGKKKHHRKNIRQICLFILQNRGGAGCEPIDGLCFLHSG